MVAEVHMLSDKFVRKQYITDPKKRNQKVMLAHWNKELAALMKLKNTKHFPNMVHYSNKNRFIDMSYCGEMVTKDTLPKNWKSQCSEIGRRLTKLKIYHNDIFCKNITVKDGILHLIDFGLWGHSPGKHCSMIAAIEKELKV